MTITQGELDSFHRFASEKVANGGADMSWAELFKLWRLDYPTPAIQADVHQAVRTGIAEADAGLGRSADEFMEDMRRKHNIPVVIHLRGPGQDELSRDELLLP